MQANLVGFCLLGCGKKGFSDTKSRNGCQTKLSIDIVVIGSELSPQSRVFVVTLWLANLRHVLCWLAIPSYKEWSNLLNVTKTVGFYSRTFGVDNSCNVKTIGIGGENSGQTDQV